MERQIIPGVFVSNPWASMLRSGSYARDVNPIYGRDVTEFRQVDGSAQRRIARKE